MTIAVIDGQGGRLGSLFIASLREKLPSGHEILAIGTNTIATSAMLKAGANHAATGENPVIVSAKKADILVGPIGILVADALFGEITPSMAVAVGQSAAVRILIPVNQCSTIIAGIHQQTISHLIEDAVHLVLSAIDS